MRKVTTEMMDKVVYNLQRDIDGGRILDYDAEGKSVAVLNHAHGIITHRYSVEEGEFSLQSYADAMVTTGRGKVGEESDWLKRVLDVAYLGGHGLTIVSKPPDFVLWFETDAKMDLLRFIVEAEELNQGV
jgi:hypothetical protein